MESNVVLVAGFLAQELAAQREMDVSAKCVQWLVGNFLNWAKTSR